jgi:CheY-like chemotaxis protein
MAQRIFIKVVGFSDEERHALNTVFRLSEQCLTMYQLWTPVAPDQPKLLLLDGQSWEARVEAESPLHSDVPLFWVGGNPPATIYRSFPRPLAWPDVIEALDSLFAPDSVLDLDLGAGPDSVMSQKQALIVSASRDQRLYLRARLALARLTLADEAESATQALEMARGKQYDVALVDCGLGDADPWQLLRQLRQGKRGIQHVAMTQAERSVAERLRAWLGGAEAVLENPPHPGRLDAWLSRIELGPAA